MAVTARPVCPLGVWGFASPGGGVCGFASPGGSLPLSFSRGFGAPQRAVRSCFCCGVFFGGVFVVVFFERGAGGLVFLGAVRFVLGEAPRLDPTGCQCERVAGPHGVSV